MRRLLKKNIKVWFGLKKGNTKIILFQNIYTFNFFFSGSTKGSQVSTPQTDMHYDAHLQSLQHKLSAIPVGRITHSHTVSFSVIFM